MNVWFGVRRETGSKQNVTKEVYIQYIMGISMRRIRQANLLIPQGPSSFPPMKLDRLQYYISSCDNLFIYLSIFSANVNFMIFCK